jgi:hypothetical protein
MIEGDLRPARSARQIEKIEVLKLSTTSQRARGRQGFSPIRGATTQHRGE